MGLSSRKLFQGLEAPSSIGQDKVGVRSNPLINSAIKRSSRDFLAKQLCSMFVL